MRYCCIICKGQTDVRTAQYLTIKLPHSLMIWRYPAVDGRRKRYSCDGWLIFLIQFLIHNPHVSAPLIFPRTYLTVSGLSIFLLSHFPIRLLYFPLVNPHADQDRPLARARVLVYIPYYACYAYYAGLCIETIRTPSYHHHRAYPSSGRAGGRSRIK